MSRELSRLESQWTRLGCSFAGAPDLSTPDLELLILETARWSPMSPRLFVMAITWLSRYAELVAEHRMATMVRREPDESIKATLGLLLDEAGLHARRHDRRRNLRRAMKLCAPAERPGPLFELERRSPAMIDRAERRASDTSKRWNVWTERVEPKFDALRPPAWVISENPSLAFRADFRGDLRASVLLVLREEPQAGRTVSRLAKRCGASRAATLYALEDLELGGHILRRRAGRDSEATLPAA